MAEIIDLIPFSEKVYQKTEEAVNHALAHLEDDIRACVVDGLMTWMRGFGNHYEGSFVVNIPPRIKDQLSGPDVEALTQAIQQSVRDFSTNLHQSIVLEIIALRKEFCKLKLCQNLNKE